MLSRKKEILMDRTGNDIAVMMLKQMGAFSIKTSPAKVTIVKFLIQDEEHLTGHPERSLKLTYVFEARDGESTYLSRVAPYPMVLGLFFDEQDVLDYIGKDLAKFRRACTNSQFGKFISLSEDISHFNRELEHLFLERRTSDESIQYLDSNVNKLQEALDQIKEESPLTTEKF